MARGKAKVASSTAGQVAFRGMVYGAGGYRCPRPIKDVHVSDELHKCWCTVYFPTSHHLFQAETLDSQQNLGPWPNQTTHTHTCIPARA